MAAGASATGAVTAAGSGTSSGATAVSVVGGEEGAASGKTTTGCCAADGPIAALMLSHTTGRGSTEPTIWFSAPSRYSQPWTIAANSPSAAIRLSTCARS